MKGLIIGLVFVLTFFCGTALAYEADVYVLATTTADGEVYKLAEFSVAKENAVLDELEKASIAKCVRDIVNQGHGRMKEKVDEQINDKMRQIAGLKVRSEIKYAIAATCVSQYRKGRIPEFPGKVERPIIKPPKEKFPPEKKRYMDIINQQHTLEVLVVERF